MLYVHQYIRTCSILGYDQHCSPSRGPPAKKAKTDADTTFVWAVCKWGVISTLINNHTCVLLLMIRIIISCIISPTRVVRGEGRGRYGAGSRLHLPKQESAPLARDFRDNVQYWLRQHWLDKYCFPCLTQQDRLGIAWHWFLSMDKTLGLNIRFGHGHLYRLRMHRYVHIILYYSIICIYIYIDR